MPPSAMASGQAKARRDFFTTSPPHTQKRLQAASVLLTIINVAYLPKNRMNGEFHSYLLNRQVLGIVLHLEGVCRTSFAFSGQVGIKVGDGLGQPVL